MILWYGACTNGMVDSYYEYYYSNWVAITGQDLELKVEVAALSSLQDTPCIC